MNLHRLDLVSLWLFAAVARAGSISRGAELAHLAVGAASKRISDLELALGAKVFDRHSRGVTLTAAGDALWRHVQRILADVENLAADLSDHAAGVVGVVNLWANTSALIQFLPTSFATFSAVHPNIRLQLEEGNSRQIVLAVLDGRADIGIFADGTPPLGLQTLHYRDDRLALVVPSRHPLATRKLIDFADALDFDFVSLPTGTSLAERLEAGTEALGKRLRLRIQVRSFDAMCLMVAAGLGVAVLPSSAVQAHLRSMGLCRVDLRDPWARRSLLIGARDFAALPRPVRLLMDHLLAQGVPDGLGRKR